MQFWQWKCMLHEEVIFHFHDAVVVSLLVFDDFLEDVWIDLSVSLFVESFIRRKILRLYDIRSLRDVDFNFSISSQITSFRNFFFGEAVVNETSSRIIEIEWIHSSWEELS